MIIHIYNEKAGWRTDKVARSIFPDGQPHVKVPIVEGDSFAAIACSIRNPAELFELTMILEILRHNAVEPYVRIYWLFGARMDRAIDNTQPETFNAVLNVLSAEASLYKQNIFALLDIHNPAKIYHAHHLNDILADAINLAIDNFYPDCDLYVPDAGAEKRYEQFFGEHNVLVGQKKRDSATGKLSGFELKSGERKSDFVLIIDDICDAGGTFLGQYPVLENLGYQHIALYTTHGLYTKGLDILAKFARVYSTNSFEFGQGDDNDQLKLRIFEGSKLITSKQLN